MPISNEGGEAPGWSRDGKELFFFRRRESGTGQLFVVDVRTSSTSTAGTLRLLFEELCR